MHEYFYVVTFLFKLSNLSLDLIDVVQSQIGNFTTKNSIGQELSLVYFLINILNVLHVILLVSFCIKLKNNIKILTKKTKLFFINININ